MEKGTLILIFIFLSLLINVIQTVQPIGEAGTKITKQCYLPNGRTTCAPQFIISGTVKSGTKVIYDYLSNHPKVLPLKPSATLNGKTILSNGEVRFWMDPIYSSLVQTKGEIGAFHDYLDVFYPISVSDEYFQNKEEEYVDYITGESSPMYMNQFGVAGRIFKFLPEIKIIIMLRNPIDRAYSEYWFKESIRGGTNDKEVMKGIIQKCLLYEKDIYTSCSVEEFANDHPVNSPDDLFQCTTSMHRRINAGEIPSDICPINNIKYSLYPLYLFEWVKTFKNNLLVIRSEDFFKEPAHWMGVISQFLGIDDVIEFEWKNILGSFNHTSDYPDMDEDFRSEMAKFFHPINEDLADLLNKPVFWNKNSPKGE